MKTGNGKILAAGIVPYCPSTNRFLLVRRGLEQPEPNTWAFLGGKFEEDEDKGPRDNAKREFAEESGYNKKYLLRKRPLFVNKDNFLVYYNFLGLFDEEFVPVVGEGEAQDYGWFTLEEFSDKNIHPGIKEMLDDSNFSKAIESSKKYYNVRKRSK